MKVKDVIARMVQGERINCNCNSEYKTAIYKAGDTFTVFNFNRNSRDIDNDSLSLHQTLKRYGNRKVV